MRTERARVAASTSGSVNGSSGHVGGGDPPVAGDGRPGLGIEDQQRHVGEEQLADLDRDALDRGLQILF